MKSAFVTLAALALAAPATVIGGPAMAQEESLHAGSLEVPLKLRNAPTKLMKQLDYGKGYRYAHDEPDAIANMDCLPDNLKGREFYKPTEFGFEKEIRKRLAWWKSRRQQ